MKPNQYLDQSQYERAPESLVAILSGGLSFPEEELERGRQAVRRIVSKQLWDVAGQMAGQIPQDLLEESLMPYPATLLQLAIVAAKVLNILAMDLGDQDESDHFRRVGQRLQQRLTETVQNPLPPRLETTDIIRYETEILADGLNTPDEVIQWLRTHLPGLLAEHPSEPQFDPEWLRMDFGPQGIHWLNLGPVESWTDRKAGILRNALSEYGAPYRIQLRRTHQRRDRWIWVLELEVLRGTPPDQPPLLAEDSTPPAPLAGLEEVRIREAIPSETEEARRFHSVPANQEILVLRISGKVSAAVRLFAHSDLAIVQEGLRVEPLPYPDDRITPGIAQSEAKKILQKADPPVGINDLVVLHNRYVVPGSEQDWIPQDIRQKPAVLNLPLELAQRLDPSQWAFLRSVALMLGRPLAIGEVKVRQLEGELELTLYL